jgi:hypothetical protein
MQLEQRVVACGGVPRRWTAAAGCSVVQQQGLIDVCVLLLIQLVESGEEVGGDVGSNPLFCVGAGKGKCLFSYFLRKYPAL